MTINEAVKKRIIELCRNHQLSLNKLCTNSGITQSTINNFVSGRNRSITLSTLKKICDGLDITVNEFFDSPLFLDLEPEVR